MPIDSTTDCAISSTRTECRQYRTVASPTARFPSSVGEHGLSVTTEPQASYDRVADEYVRRIYGELEGKPLDRQLLERFASPVKGAGYVADIGCGPGHIARYLRERGVDVCGVDLSQRMIARARALNPGIQFFPADLTRLPIATGAWAGIVAFYSIIHVAREQVLAALQEFKRVLRPGGRLLFSFHVGDTVLHMEEWWGEPVCLDFVFFQPNEMSDYVRAAGLELEEVIERAPYAPDVEHQSRRCYIFARKGRPLVLC